MDDDTRHNEVKEPATKENFLQVYEDYSDAIFRFCLTKTRSRDIALDLTQDTFIKTWEYLANGKTVDQIRPFLYRVARNLIIDLSRKKTTLSLDSYMEDGGDIKETNPDQFGIAFDVDQALKLVGMLDAKYREPITLRHVENLSLAEIAKVMGVSENVVSVRLHRGIKQLQELVAEKFPTV